MVCTALTLKREMSILNVKGEICENVDTELPTTLNPTHRVVSKCGPGDQDLFEGKP